MQAHPKALQVCLDKMATVERTLVETYPAAGLGTVKIFGYNPNEDGRYEFFSGEAGGHLTGRKESYESAELAIIEIQQTQINNLRGAQ